MKTKLTEEEKATVLPAIQAVLNGGDRWEAPELHLPAGAIIDAVLKMPGVKKGPSTDDGPDGFSQNGWDYDWWQEFVHGGRSYTLSGSGYYGGHAFQLSDED